MNSADDPYNLQRFVDAQRETISAVLAELKHGRKYGHWIWFIFPQLKGLGRSSTSKFYGISSLEEARAYLRHPVLGPRLIQCAELVNALESSDAEDIFGEIDSLKFRSCMTLFRHAEPDNAVFFAALQKFFQGQGDPLTLQFFN